MEDLSRPEALQQTAFERRLYGVFREPIWFRLPLACLSFTLAYEILLRRWFEARKRAVFTLVVAWFVVLGVISLLVLVGVLR